jgi:two-component system, NarL family, sensor histidine kinase DegS
MSAEHSTLLDSAHSIVATMLSELRSLVESSQQRGTQLTTELRQAERALDEMVMQHQFAADHNLPTAATLASREQELRAALKALQHEAQSLESTRKQLDQLVRQIDMSSTTLDTDDGSEQSDPWVQALKAQVILGREEERVRLAREVHDSPAQVLANALIGLEQSCTLLEEGRMEALNKLLGQIRDTTREGLQEVRNFIADLRPGRLQEQGLVNALRDYIQRYSTTHQTRVTFEADSFPRLSHENEIVLYRIVQESLQNAHKHARGASIHVTLAVRQQTLLLTIQDEGPGFDPRDVARRAGRESWGLTSMRERAELIGARYKVTSRPGHGTTVSVSMPLP